MKKLVTLFLVAIVCLSVASCGGGGGDMGAVTTQMALGEVFSVENYADFKLIGIETTKKVTASMQGYNYYENDNPDETYLDIVLDVTNTGAESVMCDEFLSATAVGVNGTEYASHTYAIETDDMTRLSSYDEIDPMVTARLHALISVPVAESAFSLRIDVNGKIFTCDYSAGTTIKETTYLNVGDVVGDQDYATLKFVGAKFADKVTPSNTNGFYTYMEVDDADKTYLALEFEVTNYQTNEKDVEKFVSATATFMGKYEYTGFVVSEDSNGIGTYNSIAPLETVRAFVLIEVPKNVTDKGYSAEVCFDKQFYTVNG